MAVALRFATDKLIGEGGITWEDEGCEVVEMLADLPDLWDVNVSDRVHDSETSRFSSESFQEPPIAFVKGLVKKTRGQCGTVHLAGDHALADHVRHC